MQFGVAHSTGSISYNFDKLIPLYLTIDSDMAISSNTGSIWELDKLQPLYENKNASLDISVNNNDKSYSTSSLSLSNQVSDVKNSGISVATSTGSIPSVSGKVRLPVEGTFKFSGDEDFIETLNKSFINLNDSWGTGANDTYFINYSHAGKDGTYNSYHFEKRYIFYTIGDVETVSGSYASVSSSFKTDYTGTVTAGIHTGSGDFTNQQNIKFNDFFGLRPLGTTIEFKSGSSISTEGGKFLDETFAYPPNHIFLVGSSKDSLNNLIYDGTQNAGGDIIESEAYQDLWEDKAFYYVPTTGGYGWTVPYTQ